VLVFASTSTYAVSSFFDLDGNATLESSAVSTVAGGVCVPCTITHTVNNGIGIAQAFNWTGPGFAGKVAGPGTTSMVFTTFLSVVEDVGNISFLPAAVAGPASYKKPVVSAVVYYGGELISTLFQSPANIEFKSTLTPLGPDSFEYTHTVMNYTASPVDLNWGPAQLSGVVDGYNSITRSFVASAAAFERVGFTSFNLSGTDFTMPAHAWVPAPEPSTIFLFGIGLLGLAGAVRWRKNQ